MQDNFSNVGQDPKDWHRLLKATANESLSESQERIEKAREKVWEDVSTYFERKVKPYKDISPEEVEEARLYMFECHVRDKIQPLAEQLTSYDDSLAEMLDKCGRFYRKLERTESEINRITEFEHDRLLDEALGRIRKSKEKDINQ